jgi:hypothetical protein
VGDVSETPKRKGECCLCPAHPLDDDRVILWRVNPTGEDGVFACDHCYEEASRLWAQGKILPGGSLKFA